MVVCERMHVRVREKNRKMHLLVVSVGGADREKEKGKASNGGKVRESMLALEINLACVGVSTHVCAREGERERERALFKDKP